MINELIIDSEKLFEKLEKDILSGECVKINIRGTSMQPFLRDKKDSVTLAPLNDNKIKRGDIILFKRESGSYVMHRVYRVNKDGSIDFIGDNQFKLECAIKRSQLKAYAKSVTRKGKNISCNRSFLNSFIIHTMVFRVKFPTLSKGLRNIYKRVYMLFHKK